MVLDIVSLQTVAAVTFFTGTRKYPKIIGVLSTLQRAYRDLQYTKREDKTRVKVFVITIISTLLFSISFVNLVISDLEVANDFYCDQLMAVVFSLFVHVTIKSYFFFLHVRAGEVFASTTETAWVLAHICYELLLFKLSTEVTNSADETGPVICKLINKDVDPNLRKELEVFLLQLPHHHARFSARGFFQIHNETLTSMAGAVTTYLVILIQIQTQPPSKID
ncbi:gustatory receptor 68a-like [Homalodisca vitripennis]|uniref:gustatory receptor 68a-like n=1 Tax=Homalodisca vitripennis TaxID=197043 RepID=UPI001EEBA4DD|nr:gustatory receptor 68a-like [Homalodisca vitripennis]